MESDLTLLRATVVGEGNEELTTGESEEAGIDVALNVGMVPDLGCLALGVDLSDELVEIGGRVHVLPERLTVLGIVSASVVLLGTVVGEGDTTGGHGEDLSLLEARLVVVVAAEEAAIVVVVDEDTKGIDVTEVAVLLFVSVADAGHVLACAEDVADRVEHWVVEETGEVLLVGSNVCGVTVEALSHLEDAGGLTELTPELALDLRDGIDTDAIEAVLRHDALNPVLEVSTDVIVVLVEIGEASEAAVLFRASVAPLDIAVIMVMLRLV